MRAIGLSVVIPTRDRPERIARCLETLAAQDIPVGTELDIVVVDDGSEPALEIALGARAGLPPVLCLRQAAAGLNAARNRGAAEARSEAIAFLDDDTLVDPGWAQAVLEALAIPGCDAVGGRVTLALEADAPVWLTRKLRRYLAEFDLGEEPRWLPGEPVPVGANCAVTRAALEAAGGFLDGLDRVGASLLSNGDTEFFRRLQRRGGRIRYAPAAHVRHCVPAERLTIDFFRRRAYAQGRSDALLARRGAGHAASQARELVRAGRSVPIAARGVLAGRGAVTAGFWVQYCRGRMAVLREPERLSPREGVPA
jgi:GT2 family glycosyltransferase